MSWLERLKKGLTKTSSKLTQNVIAAVDGRKLDQEVNSGSRSKLELVQDPQQAKERSWSTAERPRRLDSAEHNLAAEALGGGVLLLSDSLFTCFDLRC